MSCNIYPKPCNIYLKACNILCKHSEETLDALSGTLQGISNSLRGGMTKRGQKKGETCEASPDVSELDGEVGTEVAW